MEEEQEIPDGQEELDNARSIIPRNTPRNDDISRNDASLVPFIDRAEAAADPILASKWLKVASEEQKIQDNAKDRELDRQIKAQQARDQRRLTWALSFTALVLSAVLGVRGDDFLAAIALAAAIAPVSPQLARDIIQSRVNSGANRPQITSNDRNQSSNGDNDDIA